MMTINDQIKDEKLQYDINRKAAIINALSSGKLHKYEYLTGGEILPSNQQQIIEQTKFTHFPLGKAFHKQIKTIGDQGKKQVDALKKLRPKEETKLIEDTPNNQSEATTIFNGLVNKRKELMNKLYDSVNYNNLNFKQSIRSSQIRFSDAKNKQNELLNKLTNIMISRKTLEQEKIIDNLDRFYLSRQDVINFFRDFLKCYLIQITRLNKMRLKEQGLKY